MATLLSGTAKDNESQHYPSNELTRLWKLVLLNQFHDVLPGTSIADVSVSVLFSIDVFTLLIIFINKLLYCYEVMKPM